MAIINSDKTCAELREMLYKRCAVWHGKIVNRLSVSAGIIQNTDAADIDGLIARADAEMYAEKARYYAESGQKRR